MQRFFSRFFGRVTTPAGTQNRINRVPLVGGEINHVVTRCHAGISQHPATPVNTQLEALKNGQLLWMVFLSSKSYPLWFKKSIRSPTETTKTNTKQNTMKNHFKTSKTSTKKLADKKNLKAFIHLHSLTRGLRRDSQALKQRLMADERKPSLAKKKNASEAE